MACSTTVLFGALCGSLFCRGSSTVASWAAFSAAGWGERTPALHALVLGVEPFERETLMGLLGELLRAAGAPAEPALREGLAVVRAPNSGRIMVAMPPTPALDELERALDDVLARMNAFVAAPPHSDTIAYAKALARLIGDFLHLHPFVDGNGRVAEALMAAMVRRTHASRLILHIGARDGSNYRDWCEAVLDYQLKRADGEDDNADAMVAIIECARHYAYDLLGMCGDDG